MRVTGMMQNIQLMKNLRNTNSNITEWQDKLATGQRIHRPGDDPVGIGYLMRYNSELNRTDEFLENARTGSGWLRTMDSLMQQTSDILKRARVLTQQASTGTVPADARVQIASEMRQLREQLVTIGNSDYSGRYLFNGQKTDIPPYTVAGAETEQTDPGVYYLSVSASVTVPVSITGEKIFGAAGAADNMFKVLKDIATHLDNNDQNLLLQDLKLIDDTSNRLSLSWAEIGARMNRFDLVENHLLDEQIGLKELRSEVGDVDMTEAITELKLKENVLQAALSTGARIMQVSLIDFIR
ncbi:flagellar hook-associated protein FlgL [Paenibacillus oenotherae]|uniref:Flagellar hook-associated protein FlgL n=1 Tax=Paenibacillus oenotherae TaxID=1435645 RepID=A0ABS7D4Y1_9BACL|nr:flagellar hook-associated protein FlgL [Paenibacillus oenotherae]MBW7474994.1 flagellar hook-associated protein FlgL [Paenibacillus oenotherae]